MSRPTIDPAHLPRPKLTLTPGKAGYPKDGGGLDLVVDVGVPFPPLEVDRNPIDLALVIDRSGSMSGAPLEAAKRAAAQVVSMLMPGDWVAVVAFDNAVTVPVPLVRVDEDRRAILAAIDRIVAGDSTALHAGWTEGVTQAMACPDGEAMSRVVLLSDGQANAGIADVPTIAQHVAAAAGHGVTTTALGLGAHYDEHLLRAVADAGRGRYDFIAGPDQVVAMFEHELAGLSALRGRSVRLRAASGRGCRLVSVGAGLASDERGIVLPDLMAGLPLELLVHAELEPGARTPKVVLEWDDVLSGERDEVTVKLAVKGVSAASFAALPTDARVAELRELHHIATAKDEMARSARSGDRAAVEVQLQRSEERLERLSPEARAVEAPYLEQLRRQMERGDFDMVSRSAQKQFHDRTSGRDDVKLGSQLREERDWREEKLAAIRAARRSSSTPVGTLFDAAPPSAPAGRTLFERSVPTRGAVEATVQIVVGDITDETVDAIVNSTNRGLFGNQGVDGAVHRRGGPGLTAAARSIGSVDYGEAVFTAGFSLAARYVIHTATVPWKGSGRELETLARCYAASLSVAERLGARTLAIPAIGTGAYGYPVDDAARVAVESVTTWLRQRGGVHLVRFVLFDEGTARAYQRALE